MRGLQKLRRTPLDSPAFGSGRVSGTLPLAELPFDRLWNDIFATDTCSHFCLFSSGTWILLVGLPIWLTNALPPSLEPELGLRDYLGIGLWAASFLVEVVADSQKSSWQRAKKSKLHHEKFISSGLWSLSRHPKCVQLFCTAHVPQC
jgi:steroid 5-alpha reductase family enzyme